MSIGCCSPQRLQHPIYWIQLLLHGKAEAISGAC